MFPLISLLRLIILTATFIIAACHIEFEGRKMTFNQTDLKMTNGVVHLINEVIYTNDSARESQLTSSSPNHHISSLLFIMMTYVLLLML